MAEPVKSEIEPLQAVDELNETQMQALTPAPEGDGEPQSGFGLQSRLLLFLVLSLASLALAGGLFAAFALNAKARDDFAAKGEAIARTLAGTSADFVFYENEAGVQALIDDLVGIEGVAYLAILEAGGGVFAHTFLPDVPEEVLTGNPGTGAVGSRQTNLVLTDPETGVERSILDTAVPIRSGRLGTVRVGMDLGVAARQTTEATLPLLLLLGGLFLLFLGAAYLFARRTVRPIQTLAAAAERLGEGDLDVRVPVTSGDEVGFLTETFNQSVSRIRELINTREEAQAKEREANRQLQSNIGSFLQVAMQMARGDLTRRGTVTEDVLGNVVDSINVVVEEIGDLLSGVRDAADTVNAGARDMIGVSDRMVSGVRSQAEVAAQVSGHVEEMTRAMRAVSESAEGSSTAARRTLEAAQQGQRAVEGTLDGIRGIRGEVQSISKRIKSLGDRSLEISEIVDTITNISNQTNLLALNAAIEASGAGAEGSRFGVVANEVRALALDTTAATKRVATLIQAVQAEVGDAIVAMESGTEKVESGFKVANEAGDRLREIASVSGDSANLAGEISRAAREQVAGVERVSEGVGTIAEVAEQTQLSVAEGRRGAEQLLQLSEQLRDRMARFKTQGQA